jgi:mono/diheme cytochrome c family protein
VRLTHGLTAICALAASLGLGATWWRGRNKGPVQRGFATAQRHGCFNCHGPGGLSGFEGEPGIGGVPALGGELPARGPSEAEVRDWILEGTAGKAAAGEEPAALLRMPAFRGILSAREVDDVVAYVKAIGGADLPRDGLAADGHEIATRFGCFQCHGPGGRGDPPNPGSLKGYVPSWSGADFLELARDETETRAWVMDGAPPRLREHPVARFFLARQAIQMPAYRGRISDAQMEALLAYIRWLRRGGLASG